MLLKSVFSTVFITVCASAFGQTLIEKADKQYELHAYRLAAKSYAAILANNDDQWGASLRLADCYLHLNDLEKAATQYARAIVDGQAQTEDYLRYGRVLMMLGQYEAAEKKFKVYEKTNAAIANQFIKACAYARSNSENPSGYDVTPLSKVNTNAAEFGVTIWKDKIVWSSTRTDFKRVQNNTPKNDLINGEPNQLFIAPIEGVSNQAFKINFLKTDLRNTFNESNPSFSPDGKTVAFMRNNLAEDERVTSNGGLEMSLFLADIDAQGNWLNVHPFPYNSNSTGFPCFSPDGKTLYYASNRPGGFGGFDVYKSEKKGIFWGEPKNLGAAINSQGDEITPFYDGKTLFFASDWHFGFGGYDIFKVVGSEVINLGTGVNSSGDDYGFVFAPTLSTGFLVSNRKGVKGKDDLYEVKTTTQTATNIVFLENGKPLKDVQIKVTQGNAANLSLLKGGNYLADLSDSKPLVIEAKKEGFKTQSIKISPESNAKGVIEVIMERTSPTQMNVLPEYIAMITDASSGEPLEGAVVRLVNENGNTQTELKTDVKGKVRFPMAANGSFSLTFSKEGFIEVKKTIKAADFKTRYLGEFPLKPSAVTNPTPITTTSPQTTITKPSSTKPKPGTEYSIVPSSGSKEGVETAKNSVYAVQFAVLHLTDALNVNKYENLRKEGNIYAVSENGLKKVRLGIFKTREEVTAATKKASSLGYKDAFIVEEKNEEFLTEKMLIQVPKPVKIATLPSETKPKEGVVDVPEKQKEMPEPYSVVLSSKQDEDKSFKVRIASMKNPKWFDESKLSKLGKIEKIQEGDYTIFFMDGFKNLDDAKTMKKKVQATGYSDAQVVVKEGKNFKIVD